MHVSFVDFCPIVRINDSLLNAPYLSTPSLGLPKLNRRPGRLLDHLIVTNIKYPENISLRSWRYYVIKVLAAEQ